MRQLVIVHAAPRQSGKTTALAAWVKQAPNRVLITTSAGLADHHRRLFGLSKDQVMSHKQAQTALRGRKDVQVAVDDAGAILAELLHLVEPPDQIAITLEDSLLMQAVRSRGKDVTVGDGSGLMANKTTAEYFAAQAALAEAQQGLSERCSFGNNARPRFSACGGRVDSTLYRTRADGKELHYSLCDAHAVRAQAQGEHVKNGLLQSTYRRR